MQSTSLELVVNVDNPEDRDAWAQVTIYDHLHSWTVVIAAWFGLGRSHFTAGTETLACTGFNRAFYPAAVPSLKVRALPFSMTLLSVGASCPGPA